MVVKRLIEKKAKALVFDIEGTTTSISFVKETLFPYVRKNLSEFVQRQWNEAEFKEVLMLLREQCTRAASSGISGDMPIPEQGSDADLQEAVVNHVTWQMSLDAKNKALKQLQGLIMREGYKKGQLKGHIYADVLPALKTWNQNGLKLYIYSSGSVEAQKLLFGHSEEGDLLEMFSGHFDTEVGAKTEASSYTKIAKQLEHQPDEIVFFTDMPEEATAAESAGLTAVLVVRDGNADLSAEDREQFLVIDSLNDFEWEVPAKRRKIVSEEDGHVEKVAAIEDIVMKELPVSDDVLSDKTDTQSVQDETKSISKQEDTLQSSEMMLQKSEVKEKEKEPVVPELLELEVVKAAVDDVTAAVDGDVIANSHSGDIKEDKLGTEEAKVVELAECKELTGNGMDDKKETTEEPSIKEAEATKEDEKCVPVTEETDVKIGGSVEEKEGTVELELKSELPAMKDDKVQDVMSEETDQKLNEEELVINEDKGCSVPHADKPKEEVGDGESKKLAKDAGTALNSEEKVIGKEDKPCAEAPMKPVEEMGQGDTLDKQPNVEVKVLTDTIANDKAGISVIDN